jgi:hypothetical protein
LGTSPDLAFAGKKSTRLMSVSRILL